MNPKEKCEQCNETGCIMHPKFDETGLTGFSLLRKKVRCMSCNNSPCLLRGHARYSMKRPVGLLVTTGITTVECPYFSK